MAKRARGTTTRPGQRRPIQRPAARPASPAPRPGAAAATGPTTETAAQRPASLTPEEEARAAELEASILAEERQAEAGRRNRAQRGAAEPVVRASNLAVAAANEYAYVARDVRRVALVGGSLVGLLFGLWVVVQVTGITL
jgi:hypothetical protein